MEAVAFDVVRGAACAGAAVSTFDSVVARVAEVCPRPSDPLEVTAVLESLGYTDAGIAETTGLPDSLVLGRVLFDLLRIDGVEPARPRPKGDRRRDLHLLLQTFSLSSVYALPWVVTFLLQRWRPDLLRVPQGAGAPLTL